MKAILLNKFGGLDALQISEVPTPKPEIGEVLVKVKAFNVSPLELKIRHGEAKMYVRRQRPMILGSDFAGDVVAVGDGVKDYRIGDAVLGTVNPFKENGPYAEYVVAPSSLLHHKPSEVSYEQACTLLVAGVSSLQSLRDLGKLQAGQKVMILGASGSLGLFGIQLAKYLGATVTAVCSGTNTTLVRKYGADKVRDYLSQPIFDTANDYDLVFDAVNKYSFEEAKKVLKKGGIYVNTVPSPKLFLRTLLNSFNSKKIKLLMLNLNSEDLKLIVDLARKGILKVHLEHVYDGLESIHEATKRLESGRVRGKLVIRLKS
jgi:NADPH:quinone reductase-like Zn-dependent oxidoreductase